ncbi:MAG TPA: acyclic terpene utilization AtuA family protein [Symbiobacteriaceae bacterium]|nr:acyclic terpene utilization AtuA family protein [Symbiobacteriaceae bacterium]
MHTVRIGAGQGFYGDSLLPVLDVARYGNVKYISFDTLAELTLAILQKGRRKDPAQGYTKDVIPMMRNLLPICREKGIKLITNAGGINPPGAARAVAAVARELGLGDLKIACVTGDDIYDRLDELAEKGVTFQDKETGQALGDVRERVLFASVYLGADVIAEALRQGADVVITGRTTDTAQFLGPLLYEFGWGREEWNKLAQGIMLGHLMECSGQVSGGNLQVGWEDVPSLERIGYPVAEISEDGSFILTKPEGTGGAVTLRSVKEQFLYEIHDPSTYITPDVICDLTTTTLEQVGENQVRISGTQGRPAPPTLKALLGYSDGYMGEGYISFSWPKAYSKAKRAAEIVRKRLEMQGVRPQEIHEEYIGINSLWGALAPEPVDEDQINEVRLRIAIRTENKRDCEVLAREFPPLLLSGPPTASAVAGTPQPRELMGLWSTLLPRELIEPFSRVQVSAASQWGVE